MFFKGLFLMSFFFFVFFFKGLPVFSTVNFHFNGTFPVFCQDFDG